MKTIASQIHLKHSIGTRLLKVVFSIYVLISISLTALHMYSEYRNTKQEVRREMVALHQIIRKGLTNAFFDADLFQVRDILEGMATSPSVLGCKLEDTMGNTIEKNGANFKSALIFLGDSPRESGYREDRETGFFVYKFPIIYTYDVQKIRMGTLYIYSGNAVIFQKVRHGFVLIIVNAVIKTTALWIIFLYFSRSMLVRPLGILTAATEKLSPDNLQNFKVDVGIRGRNELKILEEAFNSMVRKLHNASVDIKNYTNALDRNRRQLNDIVNNSPTVISVKDTSGKYMLVNREFERIFNSTRDRILGKTDHDMVREEPADFLKACDLNAFAGRRPVETEINIPLDDGVHTYICNKFPLYDAQKNIYGVCGIATDISEHKKAEQILKDFNEKLKQEVDQRTSELRRANLCLQKQQAILERLSTIDGLTNIPNRRQFDKFIDKEWRRAQRTEKPIALILMDIDYFKKFNDHYGHASGDECLRKVAQALAHSLGRASDFVSRYGGEEFAAVLSDTKAESAAIIAEKMRGNVECLNIPHAASEVSDHVTLSLGVALLIPTQEIFPANLIEMADNALYQAKSNGRNQVEYAESMKEYLK